MSIRLKLTLWYTGVLALMFLLCGIILYVFLSFTMYNDQRAELKTYGEDVNSAIRLIQFFGIVRIQLPDLDAFQSSGTFLQGINLVNGEVTASSNLLGREIPFTATVLERMKTEPKGYYETVRHGGYEFLVYYQPLSYERNLVGVLQVARIVNNIEEFLQNLKYMLLLAGVFTTALAASLGWFLAKKTLQPIEVVIDATRQIQNSEDLNLKIEYFGPQDEIGRLTETINGMLGRIQVSYENLADSIRAQRRFVADASHELRTPLTTIRGNVDLLRKIWNPLEDGPELDEESKMSLSLEAIHDISEEAERMSRLVNDLLTLARSDAGIQMAKESIELLPIIAEVVRKAQFFPKSVRFEVGEFAALENVFVIGNKDYLQQLFFIFLENAFKYTMEGCVRLEVTRTVHQVGIRISDTGLGLDEAEIPLIFERFYRADPSRGVISGTGLGLSIAKWIMDEHEGSIEVMTMREEGTTFVIWLPTHSPTFDEPLHFEI